MINSCQDTDQTGIDFDSIPENEEEFESLPDLSSRPVYEPGELVDYLAQTGDTVQSLAHHFNTTEEEIRKANPIIPENSTTLPPGLPLQIPIYYLALWGSPEQILPDNHFINGPLAATFDAVGFVNGFPGWLKDYEQFAGGDQRKGGELIEHIATNFSINPKLLLALIEFQTGALTNPFPPSEDNLYPLGYFERSHQGLYRQLLWAANTLNNGFYGWRTGSLTDYEHLDGRLERPDPWQNAGTIGLHYYFSKTLDKPDYWKAIQLEGFLKTYTNLFGDPWKDQYPHIEGSLEQPEFILPFEPGKMWAYTGGPHTGWGEGEPFAAIDFAPPSEMSGCIPSFEWVTAQADGMIVRTSTGIAVLDLDKDGLEQTGWVIVYLHLATVDKIKEGEFVSAGDPIGHPSCEGGTSTGTHVHISRKYNGEWIPAGGPLAFAMEDWITVSGEEPYEGTLERYGGLVQASLVSDNRSLISSDRTP